ncbi:fumarylacetoacetate hydrolase family protein [Candidatus Bathyarchaeota archaeon]|nr:fumarylacetoacetate hydrolase family protein [Candidatus Bathyarchaeota archaeon]
MKLLTYLSGNEYRWGALIEGENILDLNRAFDRHLGYAFEGVEGPFKLDMISLLELGDRGLQEVGRAVGEARRLFAEGEGGELIRDGTVVRLSQVKLAAPIPRPRKNIVCLGLNYPEHVAEGSRARGEPPRPLPEAPVFFTKPPTSVIGPYDDIIYPRVTERLDYEVELAFVVGRRGKYIPREEAYKYIAGYMAFNDVTARDLQRRHQQWFKGKGCDTFAPMGPYLVTADEVGDPMNLDLWLRVNGEVRQFSNTRNMIFGVDEILSILSDGMTVEVGDIVATGTPSGVGSAHPSGLLKVGDLVEAGVEKIGMLRNRVVAEEPGSPT